MEGVETLAMKIELIVWCYENKEKMC